MSYSRQPIFDGHNDSLLRAWRGGSVGEAAFLAGDPEGHLDLPRALESGLTAGLFAIFVPAPPGTPADPDVDRSLKQLAPPLPPDCAKQVALEQMDVLARLAPGSGEALRQALTVRDADAAEPGRSLACFAHLEGAEPVAADLSDLEQWYARGVRSMGLVWARANAFAEGVPLRYPSSPDTGPGLTHAGKDLVRQCRRLGILVDVSHLNQNGFFDVARVWDGPVVASHSNAHALCPAARNLTDEQLAVIRDTRGVAGVSLNVSDLNFDGSSGTDTPMETILRHIEHIAGKAGPDCVALGSDFDGCPVPDAVRDVRGLPRIAEALRERGWPDGDIRRLLWDNWMRVLRDVLRPAGDGQGASTETVP